jgi:F-type H+-transporting ATPase subunit epsilon
MKFRLEIVTPERLVYSDQVDGITIPTLDGEIGILAHHMPLVSIIAPGEIKVRKNEEVQYIAISGGFVKVVPAGVTILADTAEQAEEIDIERATRARERAEKFMKERKDDRFIHTEAVAALERALARIKVARRKIKK